MRKKSMKKGQNAFEFLTTYGTMILIVVIIIAALAFFNYLDTGRLIPDNCSFSSVFECTDFQVTTGAATVELENSFGEPVVIDSLTVIRSDGSECTLPASVTLNNGEVKQFIVENCNNGQVDGKFNGNIRINYRIGTRSFTQIGDLTTRVQSSLTTTTSITTTTVTTTTSTTSTSTTSTTSTTTSTTTTVGVSYSRALGPTVAIDNFYIEQISPDAGANDGTVDLSNNDVRWLTDTGANINVTAWNFTIPGTASVTSAIASCEIDNVNMAGGDLSFSYWTGAVYSSWLCTQTISTVGTYTCNLFANGLDTPTEVNDVRLRCRMVGPGGSDGFSVDHMMIRVGYTA